MWKHSVSAATPNVEYGFRWLGAMDLQRAGSGLFQHYRPFSDVQPCIGE
jgi:hypothetical protein